MSAEESSTIAESPLVQKRSPRARVIRDGGGVSIDFQMGSLLRAWLRVIPGFALASALFIIAAVVQGAEWWFYVGFAGFVNVLALLWAVQAVRPTRVRIEGDEALVYHWSPSRPRFLGGRRRVSLAVDPDRGRCTVRWAGGRSEVTDLGAGDAATIIEYREEMGLDAY